MSPCRFRCWAPVAGALLGFALAAPARADNQYEYVGKVFTAYSEAMGVPDDERYAANDTWISVLIHSQGALVAGSGLSRFMSFVITGSNGSGAYAPEDLVFPSPYPLFPECAGKPGMYCDPLYDVTFRIGAVDAAGRPVDWDIGIRMSYVSPTGREYRRWFSTATHLDAMSGGYEGFTTFEGSLVDRPGVWTASVVPEPAAAAMWLAGLVLLGIAARLQ
jgi:hypothetical protein